MRWFVAIALTLLVCFGAVVACTDDTTTTTYIPETGVTVRAETLTNGIGCGTADGQIYKYAAIAVNADQKTSIGGLFDCYADGILVNLQPSTSGSLYYTVLIYAWDQRSYNASAAQIVGALPDPNSAELPSESFADAFIALNPTYYTPYINDSGPTGACLATQVINIQVVAVCPPLTPLGALTENLDAGTQDADADASAVADASDSSAEASTLDGATDAAADDGAIDGSSD